MLFAAVHESAHGTKRTGRAGQMMSVKSGQTGSGHSQPRRRCRLIGEWRTPTSILIIAQHLAQGDMDFALPIAVLL